MEWPFNVFHSYTHGNKGLYIKLTLSNKRAFGFTNSLEI